MQSFVVPLVSGLLFLGTWCLGYVFYRYGASFSRELVVQPRGWPLSNFVSFLLELVSYAFTVVAYLVAKSYHDENPWKVFPAIDALTLLMYSLLFVFLLVYSYDLRRYLDGRSRGCG